MIIKNQLLIFPLIFCSVNLFAQCWNLVWEEDFSGTTLNTSNWSYQEGAGGWGNNELQYYTNGTNNLTVSGGDLHITAREESYNGSNYTSARIRTINKADFTYGKMEARIQLPEGQGIWPAFWMMPTNSEYGGWPASGEMDIMEYLGHQTNIAYGTCHYGYIGDHQFSGSNYTLPSGDFPDDYYIFSMEWEPDTIKWFVNDNLYFSIKRSDLGTYPWVYDKDFHFILNVAVGGNWPGPPDNTTVFPQTMKVDYVRVYKMNADLQVAGSQRVIPGATTVSYTTSNLNSATYQWSVPADATIVSGQGTSDIIVDFGSASGDVSCVIVTGCGTKTITHPVIVSNNYFENPDFEMDYQNWNLNLFSGSTADPTIITDNPQQGLKSAKIDVTNGGPNPWSVQLSRNNFSLKNGVTYYLKFWAKAETNGVQIPFAFIKNQPPWTLYSASTITLLDTWTEYTYSFTSNVDDDVIFNLDLGGQTGEYYFDDFYFGLSNLTCPSDWVIATNPTDQDLISASRTLANFGNIEIQSGKVVEFKSGESITLLAPFQAHSGTDFKASIEDCMSAPLINDNNDFYNKPFANIENENRNKARINIFPNPTENEFSLIGLNSNATITIINNFGKVAVNKMKPQSSTIDISSFPSGLYTILIEMDGEMILKRIVKI